jgi:hypothetical protein
MAVRVKDVATGDQPLRSVLSAISEQVDLVEDNIGQLYDNWFIETCQEWVVPYIGDLIGYEVLHESGEPTGSTSSEARALDRILIPRQDVGNTVHARRRKGTLGVLPELARDVAGWPAIAVEFGMLASATQAVNDLWMARGRTVDLHSQSSLEDLAGPRDAFSRVAEVRGNASPSAFGSLPTSGVGLFVPRYRSYSISYCTAGWIRNAGDHCFTFSPVGEDVALFARAKPGPTPDSQEAILPVALSRDDVSSPVHYGIGKSLTIWISEEGEKTTPRLVPIEAIVPANLTHWRHTPELGTVAVDPLRGRISFPPAEIPRRVFVAYHYGFSFEIGAGEYPRAFKAAPNVPLLAVVDENVVTFSGTPIPGIDVAITIDGSVTASYTSTDSDTAASVAIAVAKAIDALGVPGTAAVAQASTTLAEGWIVTVGGASTVSVAFPSRTYRVSSGGAETHRHLSAALARWKSDAPARATIEIEDSEVYDEDDLDIELSLGQYLEIRATSGARPVIRMVDTRAGGPDLVDITGAQTATLALDGLLIAGGLRVVGRLGELIVRRSTLVPGWTVSRRTNRRTVEPSIAIRESLGELRIEKSIVGPISVEREETAPRPLQMTISDSIVDADHRGEALCSPDAKAANVELRVIRATVLGRIRAHSIVRAENAIFDGEVTVTDCQHGCFRFCYVPPKSKTPSQYECQPSTPDVAPAFISRRFGDAGYARQQDDAPPQILEGADDRSEMGAFHDLFLPQRKANLITRLAEYTPAGVVTSIIPV